MGNNICDVYAVEYWACNECGEWPIVRIVNTYPDGPPKDNPKCNVCNGETHFEKAYACDANGRITE